MRKRNEFFYKQRNEVSESRRIELKEPFIYLIWEILYLKTKVKYT